MKKMKCTNNSGEVIVKEVFIADSFFERLCGLMFSKHEKRKSILVSPTQSIHTCFMQFNIDVILLDKKNVVVKVIRNMKPWRVTGFYWAARKALEVPSGELSDGISIGEQLEFNYV